MYTTSGPRQSANFFRHCVLIRGTVSCTKSYQIVSGLLDTFPSATWEIRVLDLDERTVYKIIAFMIKFALNTKRL
ncbi:hypothetical protein OUZ56_011891 [Daphnia magna]|uniref:Uncharacterized protein n=1 Tax=Daphnia magna TaxID=35525 RepID=A0ABQ9Z1G2_9CRUS|nr:hypothetical protein OUZ56_011891 [Daphnia magna]